MKMMIVFSSVMLSTMVGTGPADAKGCLKGAIVGGAVGHYAGHHGLIGTAAGCLLGRHEAAQRERGREKARQPDAFGDRSAGPAYR
jgi:hypothetical protein